MSCCGNQRARLGTIQPSHPAPRAAGGSAATEAPERRFVVCFEYVGQSGLTAIGAATGRRYRFDQHGARVVVDPRDRPSLLAVPKLKQV